MAITSFNSVFHRVDFSLLKHFFAIATFGGFSKASRATGVSQPALSLGLKKLEKSLGMKLIDRTAKPFGLTPEGLMLLTFCQRFQGSFESIMSSLGTSGIAVQKRLRVGTALSVGFGPLNELCARIEAQKECYEMELVEQNSYQLLSDVNEGRLDAAIVPNNIYDNRVKFVPLLRDKIIFVVGAKYRGTFSKGNWKQCAARIPLVTFSRETPMRALTDKICVTEQVEFKTTYAVNSMEAVKLLVEQGRGGAFVVRKLVASELESKKLFEEKLPITLPSSGVALVLPKNKAQNTSSKLFEKLLSEKKS